jgi:hypothetical protein|tara:strand:+ start:4854 stop:8081 length:3228 start_codon:yes stop_codon:yes gene_type:complete
MATYLKGVNTYLPEIEPFTPDYKFLSAVIDTKTSKYDANFQAANELYNKVVYADLSRQENKEKRDQFAEQIGPQIEKISGMDLSIQRNADAAKSVFAPFVQDDNIVKDIVYTSKYRKEMALAQRLETSPIQEQRERFWNTGVRAMQYQMDDFINADDTTALNMQLPTYVEDADLAELASKMLEEMDPPLSMKVDHYAENVASDGTKSVNSDWIITEQNGALITGAALQAIQSKLLDDPRVQKAYQADAFVKSRNFAAAGIQAGQFSSIEQGVTAFADETIERITDINDAMVAKDTKKLKELENANVNWDNYAANEGVIPGSEMDKLRKETMSASEATAAALQAKLNIQKIGNTPSKTDQGKINRAYQMLMSYNINGDMQNAAVEFGNRDREYTMRVNTLKENQRNRDFKVKMEERRAANNRANILLEDALKNQALQGNLDVFGQQVITGDAQSITTAVEGGDGEEVEFTESSDVVKMNENQAYKFKEVTSQITLQAVRKFHTVTNSRGQNDDGSYTMDIGGEAVTGTLNSLMKQLGERKTNINGDDMGYKYPESIKLAYNTTKKIVKNYKNEITAKNPEVTKLVSNGFNDLYDMYYGDTGLETRTNAYNNTQESLINNVYAPAYATTLELARNENGGANNVKLLMDNGFPSIMGEDGVIMGFNDYEELVQQRVQQKQISNVDRYGLGENWGKGGDGGDSNYRAMEAEVTRQYTVRTSDGPETRYKYGPEREVIKTGAVSNDAKIVYDLMYNTLNAGLTGRITSQNGMANAIPTGSFNSIMQGKNIGTYSDLLSQPVYSAELIPKPGMTSPEGVGMLNNFNNQISVLDRTTPDQYGIFQGNMIDKDTDEYLEKDPFAKKVYELWKKDWTYYVRNDKAGNAIKTLPAATIKYFNTYGNPEEALKNFAGNQLQVPASWLRSKGFNGSDIDGEYGALSNSNINAFLNRHDGIISFAYPQTVDTNPRAATALPMSNIVNAINANGDLDYAEFNFPAGEYDVANVRFVRSPAGTGYDYTMNYYLNTYTEGGKYTKSPLMTKSIDLTNGIQSLDYEYKQFQRIANQLKDANTIAQGKDNRTQ